MLYRFFDFHAGPTPNPSHLGEGLGVGPTRSATTRSARKIFISLALFLLPLFLSAQDTKGAQPRAAPPPLEGAGGRLRAVVVGISDYQSPQIPDLRFAHRDAAAFADWLRSPAGGSVPEANLQVLLNADATTGKIIAALGGLVADCKPGDLAYIYFSGHGDVERISKFQRGYWLSWDSPPAVYAAGACALGYLQDIISTLSDMDVQVVVVADACRAGKLAGSAVGGAQATSAALAQQFANEIKILSCQPEEFSLEGEQWGGGRGAFSYHLLDGLYGIADQDEDEFVTLKELNRYLEDHVTPEAEPHRQNPMVLGNRAMRLVRVHPELLAQRRLQKSGDAVALQKIDSKGLEELALADADSSVQALYREFLAAMKRGDLMEARDGVSPTADTLYKQLIREPALADLHGLMTRNFAAALMDEGQQILNRFLSGDLQAFEILTNEIGIKYRLLADQFYRAAELLGEKHYYYKNLHAKGLYFESYAVYDLDISSDSAELLNIKLLQQAVDEDSTAAFAWINLWWKPNHSDTRAYYIQRLENVVPNWPIFHYVAGCYFYYYTPVNMELALDHFKRAIELDSTFIPAWYMSSYPLYKLGRKAEADQNQATALRIGIQQMEEYPAKLSNTDWEMLRMGYSDPGEEAILGRVFQQFLSVDSFSVYRWNTYAKMMKANKRYAEAERAYHKMIALDSIETRAWYGLGWLYFDQARYAEMEKIARRYTELEPKGNSSWNMLGWALLRQQKHAEAEQPFLNALKNNKNDAAAWNGLGQLYPTQKRYEEAIQARRRYTELQPGVAFGWSALGQVLYEARNYPEAEAAYQKAIQLDSTNIGAFNGLALVLNRAGKYADMAAICRQGIALDSTNYAAWNNLGLALLQTEKYAESESALQRAISLNPKPANAYKHLATLYFRTGRREEAKQGFDKALELNPNYFGGYVGMAYILTADGKTAEALAQVELAIGKKATFEQLENDRDLAPLRALPEWRALIKKHFPDQAKD